MAVLRNITKMIILLDRNTVHANVRTIRKYIMSVYIPGLFRCKGFDDCLKFYLASF